MHHVNNSPPLAAILSQINPVHIRISYFSYNYFNVLPFTSRPSYWSLSFLFHGNWPSLYNLGADLIENTSPNSSSIVASSRYRTDCVENTASQLLHCCILRICCLAEGVFAEPFSRNGCLCWRYSSYLEQLCHNIIDSRLSTFVKLTE
jgi:hypothetical protein